MENEQTTDIDLIKFTAKIPENGYSWRNENPSKLRIKPSNCLTEPEPPYLLPVKSNKYIIREPLQKQADKSEPLFLYFANLDGSQKGFNMFANIFGTLLDKFYITGYDFWQKEHAEIRAAKLLLFLIKSAENNSDKEDDIKKKQSAISTLKQMILWDDNMLYFSIPVETFIIDKDFTPEYIIKYANYAWRETLCNYHSVSHLAYMIPIHGIIFDWKAETNKLFFETINTGNIIATAKHILSIIINSKINIFGVNTVLLFNNKNQYYQSFVPKHLISAMWIQILQAFTGERKYRQCDICHKWVDVTESQKNWKVHKSCANTARSEKFRQKPKEGV